MNGPPPNLPPLPPPPSSPFSPSPPPPPPAVIRIRPGRQVSERADKGAALDHRRFADRLQDPGARPDQAVPQQGARPDGGACPDRGPALHLGVRRDPGS